MEQNLFILLGFASFIRLDKVFSVINFNLLQNMNLEYELRSKFGSNGIIHHCLEKKVLYSKFISPEMTHPPLTRALARVLWLCVISREGNFYEGLFSKQWCIIFYITKAVFERFWGKLVVNPLHFYVHEN
jgi:hypothetical protein